MKKTALSAAIALAMSIPVTAFAADSAEMAELKRMILEMKQQHEQKIQQLENRVQQAEARAKAAESKVEKTETKVAAVEQKVQTRSSAGDNSFNPAISLVLQGGIATYSKDPEDYHIEGMPLGGEAGLHEEGLALWETELTASANIDNLFYGQATIGLHNHEGSIEVDVEEAFVDTLSLPAGLGMRFGRFYSALGYLNEHHTHAWDFADAPLAYTAFLGGQYRDDGIRASWVAPTDNIFLELGAEALRGDSYPGGGNDADFSFLGPLLQAGIFEGQGNGRKPQAGIGIHAPQVRIRLFKSFFRADVRHCSTRHAERPALSAAPQTPRGDPADTGNGSNW